MRFEANGGAKRTSRADGRLFSTWIGSKAPDGPAPWPGTRAKVHDPALVDGDDAAGRVASRREIDNELDDLGDGLSLGLEQQRVDEAGHGQALVVTAGDAAAVVAEPTAAAAGGNNRSGC